MFRESFENIVRANSEADIVELLGRMADAIVSTEAALDTAEDILEAHAPTGAFVETKPTLQQAHTDCQNVRLEISHLLKL